MNKKTCRHLRQFVPATQSSMAAAFGFSVGDCIAAVKLATTIVDSLLSTSKASSDCHELIDNLVLFQNVLDRVKQIELAPTQGGNGLLREVAAQYKNTIDEFLDNIQKY